MVKVCYTKDTGAAIKAAAEKLAEFLKCESGVFDADIDCDYLIGTCTELHHADLSKRTFKIFRNAGQTVFTGDDLKSVVAGVFYFIHHARLGRQLQLPLTFTSPFKNRLVMEDFPFGCYWPTGFDFDLESYVQNLVALGFTAMECNRFSRNQPMKPFHWNYAFTNPSPAYFVWTKWHENVWDKKTIDSNFQELKRVVDMALKYGLLPTFTTFLPRPYPDEFFKVHPEMRGQSYQNEFMKKTEHPCVYCLDTDNPEVQDYYCEVYSKLFDAFPEIGNLFFWHSDLGTTFKRSDGLLASRVGRFYEMLASLLNKKKMSVKVWLNPWSLNCKDFESEDLPEFVNFSIKDNVGCSLMLGTTRVRCLDATIITSELGTVALDTIDMAKKMGRDVCLAQYQDFSEDLDPIIGVPHPVMTFRKLKQLENSGLEYSSVNWGIIAPSQSSVNLNQDVIREIVWGRKFETFHELAEYLMPQSLPQEARRAVEKAWRYVDHALRIWPQFWGLRLEDSGLRLRWLTKPFGFKTIDSPEESFTFIRDRQIYRDTEPLPFNAFMELNAKQAFEVAGIYSDMVDMIETAERHLVDAQNMAEKENQYWFEKQKNPLEILKLFWTTYKNLIAFSGLYQESSNLRACSLIIEAEIANVRNIIDFLKKHPETIVIAGKYAWGQCFGPDFMQEFMNKLEIMNQEYFYVKEMLRQKS